MYILDGSLDIQLNRWSLEKIIFLKETSRFKYKYHKIWTKYKNKARINYLSVIKKPLYINSIKSWIGCRSYIIWRLRLVRLRGKLENRLISLRRFGFKVGVNRWWLINGLIKLIVTIKSLNEIAKITELKR